MKLLKLLTAVLSVILPAALLLAACGAAPPSAESGSDILVGAYSEKRELTDGDIAVFDAAMAELDGAVYEPLAVSTQVVAGTNYRFYAKAAAEPGAEASYAHVYIFLPLGEDAVPELTEIVPAEGD